MAKAKGFILLMEQIIKKILIIAIVAMFVYAGWIAFKKFTEDTSKRTKSAGITRMQKQGLDTKEK